MGISTAAKAWVAAAVLFLANWPVTAAFVDTVANGIAAFLFSWAPDVQATFSAFLVALVGAGLVYAKRNNPA